MEKRAHQRGKWDHSEKFASGPGAVSVSDSPELLCGTTLVDVEESDFGDIDSGYGSCGSHTISSPSDTEDEIDREEIQRIEAELEEDSNGEKKFATFVLERVLVTSDEDEEDPRSVPSNGPMLLMTKDEVPEGTSN